MATGKRLIDANEAYEIARGSGRHSDFARSRADLTSLEEVLEDCTTVDAVEVVHGRWEEAGFDGHGDYKECCSNCKSWSIGEDKLYCPVCGAKMDGERRTDV